MSASLIGRFGSSTFRLSAAAVSMSLTGSCFSSESAPRPFHHGLRGRGEQSSLIGRFGSSTFRLSAAAVSMSLTGSCFSSESAPRPFSNRPFGAKRFQTIHYYSVDVARGLVLLFGISTTALPSWVSRTRWNNLKNGLVLRRYGRSKRIDELHLIDRPARD